MAELPPPLSIDQVGTCFVITTINQIIDYLAHQATMEQEVDQWPVQVETHEEYEKMQAYVMQATELLTRVLNWGSKPADTLEGERLMGEIKAFLEGEHWT